MSTKPYQMKEWLDLFLATPYKKHLDLLIAVGIFKASDRGEEYIRSLNLSGDTIIITRLMSNPESFTEAFEGIDVERLAHTGFTDEQYEIMMLEEWKLDIWSKKDLGYHSYLNKWKDLFKLFPISDELKKDLPDGIFTVYRAGTTDGIAWTLNRGIAMWFFERNKLLKSEPKYNRFLSLKVSKNDVLFYHNKKGEDEVVLIPFENKVSIIPYNEYKSFDQEDPKENK